MRSNCIPVVMDGIEAVRIPLTKGMFTIVDAADAPKCETLKWMVRSSRHNFYAYRGGYKKPDGTKVPKVLLHRFLFNAPAGVVLDHINGDGLDNRRANLRVATTRQNTANSRKTVGCSSVYKGVHWSPKQRRWVVMVYKTQPDGEYKRFYLGGFVSEREAALAYDKKAAELFGEFARLNFPDGEHTRPTEQHFAIGIKAALAAKGEK